MPHKRSPQKRRERAISYEEKMVEKDTARAIVKNLCHRDNVSGDIVYTGKNKGDITSALLDGHYCVTKEIPNSKHLQKKSEKVWGQIDLAVAEQTLAKLDIGEVLNRPGEACWWR